MRPRICFRIFLASFAVGLLAVNVLRGVWVVSDEVPVDIPSVESEAPIIVVPQSERFPLIGGGAA